MTFGLRTTTPRFLPCVLLLCICSTALSADLDELLTKTDKALDEQRMDDAIALATEAIAINLKSATAYYDRGVAYGRKGQHNEAIADFTEALRLDPRRWKAYRNRGVCYMEMKDYNRANGDFTEAMRIHPNDYEVTLCRGECHFSAGNYSLALRDFEEAVRINPDSAEVYRTLARAKHAMQWDLSEVFKDTNKSLELDPNESRTWRFRARLYLDRDDLENALRDCDEAIRLDRYSADGYYVKAVVLCGQSQFVPAFDAVDTAIHIDPAMANAYPLRSFLYEERGDRANARSDLEKAIDLKPDNPLNWECRGCIRIRQGDYEGIDDIRKAYRLRSIDPDAICEGTRSHELDQASVEFGEQQVRAMLKNRPFMARYGDKAKVLYRWAALEFAGKSSGERFEWDSTLLELPGFTQVDVGNDSGGFIRRGFIRIRDTYPDGKDAGKEMGFDEIWQYVVRCLCSTVAAEEYRQLKIGAAEGKLTKDEYLKRTFQLDCDNIENVRAFYVHTFLPWAREYRVPTNPRLWWFGVENNKTLLLSDQWLHEEQYDLYALLGMLQKGQAEEVTKIAEECLGRTRLESGRCEIHLIQGYCLLKSHQPAAAIAAFDKVGDVYPQCMDAYLGRAAAYGVLGDAKKTADNIAAARAVMATHAEDPLHSPWINEGLYGDAEIAQKLNVDERLYPLRDEILHEIGRIQLWSGYSVSADSFSGPGE